MLKLGLQLVHIDAFNLLWLNTKILKRLSLAVMIKYDHQFRYANAQKKHVDDSQRSFAMCGYPKLPFRFIDWHHPFTNLMIEGTVKRPRWPMKSGSLSWVAPAIKKCLYRGYGCFVKSDATMFGGLFFFEGEFTTWFQIFDHTRGDFVIGLKP